METDIKKPQPSEQPEQPDTPADAQASQCSLNPQSSQDSQSSPSTASPESSQCSPTLRPLGLFEMLRYENSRHADPATVKADAERDATAKILSRPRRSVWDL